MTRCFSTPMAGPVSNNANTTASTGAANKPGVARLNDAQVQADSRALTAAISDFGMKVNLQAQLTGKSFDLPKMEVAQNA